MADPEADKVAPQQAVSLPLTFANSFWSADYRTGIDSLFASLAQGQVQSQELLAHVHSRADLEANIARGLYPPALRRDGFGADDGGSLRMGFEAILTSEVSEARARQALSEDLQRTILHPFTTWSHSHTTRLSHSRQTLLSHLTAYESSLLLVARLKATYHEACRQADEVEDQVLFERAKEEVEEVRRRRRRAEGEEQGGGGVGGGGGGEALPPRPDEIDAQLKREERARRKEEDDDERSEEGESRDPFEDGDEEEDDGGPDAPLKSPVAAQAAGMIGALGRAFSVRKTSAVSRTPRSPEAPSASLGDVEEGKEGKEGKEVVGEREVQGESAGEGLKKLVETSEEEVKKAAERARTTFSSLLSRLPAGLPSIVAAGNGSGEESMGKTRKVADEAEERYKSEVERCEGLRLTLESALSTHLPYLHRLETDRLRAAQSVLKSFHAAVSALPRAVVDSQKRVGEALDGLGRAERDVRGLIERRRTGPFSPRPVLFTSHYADPPLTTFGIDLRKFDETNPRGEGRVPPVVEFLVRWVEEQGKGVPEEERRKSWLYETPLSAQHRLRQLLNNPSTLSLPYDSLSALLSRPHPDAPDQTIDLPVACSTIKLWLLELEVPVVTWERYEELRAVVGGKRVAVAAEAGEGEREGAVDKEEVAKAVGKLPKIHYEVLKLIVTHLHKLIQSTPSAPEPTPTYIHKLSLSLSRALVRPKTDTALTLDDRFPSHFLTLLLSHGVDEIFPLAEEKAKREREERYRPRRQRTKPLDVRPTRAKLGLGEKESVDLGQAQLILQQGGQGQNQGQGQGGAGGPPSLPERLKQLAVAASPPRPAKDKVDSEPQQASPTEPHKRQSLLGVDTTVGGPSSAAGGGGFAASPMSATAEELPPRSAAVERASLAQGEEEKEYEIEGAKAKGEATEEPFVPPGFAPAPSVPPEEDEPETLAPSAAPPPAPHSLPPPVPSPHPSNQDESTPLAPSSSLKRSSVVTAGPPSSGRARGTRGPRPMSSSMAGKMAAFEGGGGEAGKRESWTRTVPSAPPAGGVGRGGESEAE
ncbi:hypothetical protein JCM11251_001116 [Rhodosporidiobolus azoricus]